MGDPFVQADLVVYEPGAAAPSLAVQVQQQARDLDAGRQGLRAFMALTSCPVGLLVGPQTVEILRHRYTSTEADSVVVLGKYDVPGLFRANGRQVDFGIEVQSWLDGLAAGVGWERLPLRLVEALRDEVAPVLASGRLRTTRPRFESHVSP